MGRVKSKKNSNSSNFYLNLSVQSRCRITATKNRIGITVPAIVVTAEDVEFTLLSWYVHALVPVDNAPRINKATTPNTTKVISIFGELADSNSFIFYTSYNSLRIIAAKKIIGTTVPAIEVIDALFPEIAVQLLTPNEPL